MLGAIISFLGGGAFRMIWGEVSSFLNKRQDHKFEVERMKLQNELDAAQHERNLAAIKIQAEQQVKVVEVQANADVARTEAEAWLEMVKGMARPTGIGWVDAWNASIRPAVATWSVAMLTAQAAGWLVLTEFVVSVCAAALGAFLADRTLAKRGK